jgi:hypothetical protein
MRILMVNASADVTAGGTEKHDFELVASPGNVARHTLHDCGLTLTGSQPPSSGHSWTLAPPKRRPSSSSAAVCPRSCCIPARVGARACREERQ